MREHQEFQEKKGQHRGSSSHSDLYTDENPKGTIHGLKLLTVKDFFTSVTKIRNSGKTHFHKIKRKALWNNGQERWVKHTALCI